MSGSSATAHEATHLRSVEKVGMETAALAIPDSPMALRVISLCTVEARSPRSTSTWSPRSSLFAPAGTRICRFQIRDWRRLAGVIALLRSNRRVCTAIFTSVGRGETIVSDNTRFKRSSCLPSAWGDEQARSFTSWCRSSSTFLVVTACRSLGTTSA